MAQITVTASKLSQAAESLQQLNESLNAQITILDSTQEDLCTMWEGDAKEAFNNAFRRDKAQMTNFKTAIDQYIVALNSIASKYNQAENTNIETANTRKY